MMRKLLLILLLAALIYSCKKDEHVKSALFRLVDWKVTELTMPYPNEISDLQFLNEDLGFFVNWDGEIIKVTGGGERWEKLASFPDYNLRSVFFMDENIGFVSGYQDYCEDPLAGRERAILLKTIDGGKNWEVNHVPFNILSLQFFDKMLGYEVIEDWNHNPIWYAAKTLDGGLTWQEMHRSASTIVPSLHFISRNTGFVVDTGRVYRTDNQGEDWTLIVESGEDYFLSNIYFLDDNIGFVRSYLDLYKTVDGGASWSTLRHPFGWGTPMDFSDELNGLAFGGSAMFTNGSHQLPDSASVYSTADGGKNWKETRFPAKIYINQVVYPSASTAYLYGWGTWYKFEKRK